MQRQIQQFRQCLLQSPQDAKDVGVTCVVQVTSYVPYLILICKEMIVVAKSFYGFIVTTHVIVPAEHLYDVIAAIRSGMFGL